MKNYEEKWEKKRSKRKKRREKGRRKRRRKWIRRKKENEFAEVKEEEKERSWKMKRKTKKRWKKYIKNEIIKHFTSGQNEWITKELRWKYVPNENYEGKSSKIKKKETKFRRKNYLRIRREREQIWRRVQNRIKMDQWICLKKLNFVYIIKDDDKIIIMIIVEILFSMTSLSEFKNRQTQSSRRKMMKKWKEKDVKRT